MEGEDPHRAPLLPLPSPPPPQNLSCSSANVRIFYKTRLCAKYRIGACPYTNCCFAHGQAELRDPAPNWKEMMLDRMPPPPPRWGLCRRYAVDGVCHFGDNCAFVHEDPPPRRDDRWRESEVISISTGGGGGWESGGDGRGRGGPVWRSRRLPEERRTGFLPAHRPDSGLITKAPPSKSAADPAEPGSGQTKMFLTGRKINKIYGDWLDNRSPRRDQHS